MIDLYFFTDRAATKDAVPLPALCHDMALFSIALQVLLLVLILACMIFTALFERLASVLRARSVALKESAQEFRIELQPPCKCLRFAIKWDPDIRLMINTLKKEGEEGLTRFLENEVFVWKLRSYTRNMVSKAFKANIKQDMIKLRQQRQLRARSAQKTPEQDVQDRHALRELLKQADQAAAAAQAPLVQEQVPEVREPLAVANAQKKPTATQMSLEDAAALAAMRAVEPTNSLTAAGEAEQPQVSDAFLKMLIETSKKKPMQMCTAETSVTTSMVAGEDGSSSPEALQAEQNLNGEAADAFGQFRTEDSQKKRSDAQMSFEDAAALILLMAEKPASNTEGPQTETSATKVSPCDTDGWDYDDFWAHIDVNLPPHLAAAKLFAAMGITEDSASITVAPAMPRSSMHNEDPFMGFWDKIDASMSPELVATKLLNANFVKAY